MPLRPLRRTEIKKVICNFFAQKDKTKIYYCCFCSDSCSVMDLGNERTYWQSCLGFLLLLLLICGLPDYARLECVAFMSIIQ